VTALTLRPASPLDAGRVGAIMTNWIDETDWIPRIHTRAQDISHAGTIVDRGWVTVAETDGKITGFLARDAQDIHALYVDTQTRNLGIGTQLLTNAMAQVDQLELWTFQHNTRAQAFYERHGFAAVERTDGADNDEGLPDIRYLWQRTPT
jgi:ribosomal protein S18 acetylase RimI-like enzyme